MKRPSFQFYPNDWLSASELRACSVGARGLWMDMLCLMHQGEPYGNLTLNGKGILPSILARMVGASIAEVEGWLAELETVAVFSRTEDGTIFSRRMIRDEQIRQDRAAGGVKSLNHPNVAKPKDKKAAVKGYPQRIPFRQSLAPSPSSSSSSSKEVVESAPPANNNNDVFSSIENQNALAKSVADAMGMPDVPEGKPGELMRSAIEDFRLAGITAEEVTVFVKEWYARKIKAGQSHYVLSLPFLIQDLPGWAKARKMNSQSKLKAVPAACARCQGTKTINKFDEQGWAGVAECPDCQKREVA